jgi:hypothetical protein
MSPSTKLQVPDKLSAQFAKLDASSGTDFDTAAWGLFKDRVYEYTNDLYVISRRECVSRTKNAGPLQFSGKDVERAALQLDLQRLYTRKKARHLVQICATASGILAGICGNWAYSDISKSLQPYCSGISLLIFAVLTVVLQAASILRDVEP